MSQEQQDLRQIQFRQDGPAECSISLDFPAKDDLSRCNLDFNGTEKQALPTYLRAAADTIQKELKREGEEDQNQNKFMDLPRWSVYDQSDREIAPGVPIPRAMVCDKIHPDIALFVKDWSQLKPGMDWGSALPRPPQIKQKHGDHAMRNYHLAADNPGLEPFFGQWKDKVVIIVGSGPFLEKNMDEIPADDPNVEVIAVNETCQALDDEQIDWVFMADRAVGQYADEWYSEELRKTTPLITNCISPPEVVETFEERYFWRSDNIKNADDEEILEYTQHLAPLDLGQTTTYSAYHFAFLTGAPVIIWAGMDFLSNCQQAKICKEMTPKWLQDQEYFPTHGYNGNVGLTCPRLLRNMRVIKGQTAFVADAGRVVINGTEGGIMDFNSKPNNIDNENFTGRNQLNMPLADAIDEGKSIASQNGTVSTIKEAPSWQMETLEKSKTPQ